SCLVCSAAGCSSLQSCLNPHSGGFDGFNHQFGIHNVNITISMSRVGFRQFNGQRGAGCLPSSPGAFAVEMTAIFFAPPRLKLLPHLLVTHHPALHHESTPSATESDPTA